MGGFGFPPVEQMEYRAPAPVQALFELRPLSIGEILDRTFTLYRQRFWLYVGLSAVTAAVATLSAFLQITLGLKGGAAGPDAGRVAVLTFGVLFVTLLVHLIAYSITQAATVSAVAANYLGRETSIGAALGTVRGKWYRYILVALWQGWSVMWPMLIVILPASILVGFLAVKGGGRAGASLGIGLMILLMLPAFVCGFILYLRNSLGIVACVNERLGVRAAMKRSKFLVADFKLRAFLLYLIMAVLAGAAGAIQAVFNLFLTTSHGPVRAALEITTLLVTFLSAALVQPVGAIAFVLFYIDQRVRKEGYDVEMLLEKVTGVAAPPRQFESPFGQGPLGGESPFSVPLGQSAVPAREADSPFSRPLGPVEPPAKAEESPFSSDRPFGTRES